jgi:hypothetical protein
MQVPSGWGNIAPTHFYVGTKWGWEVSVAPRPCFTPTERTPGTHCTGGWVGLRPGLDTEDRGKILCIWRGSNPGRPVCSQTLYWLSYRSSDDRMIMKIKYMAGTGNLQLNVESEPRGVWFTSYSQSFDFVRDDILYQEQIKHSRKDNIVIYFRNKC